MRPACTVAITVFRRFVAVMVARLKWYVGRDGGRRATMRIRRCFTQREGEWLKHAPYHGHPRHCAIPYGVYDIDTTAARSAGSTV